MESSSAFSREARCKVSRRGGPPQGEPPRRLFSLANQNAGGICVNERNLARRLVVFVAGHPARWQLWRDCRRAFLWSTNKGTWAMGWNQLAGAIREIVSKPRPHRHLVGVSAMNERTHRVLAWSVSDTLRGDNLGAAFYWGSADEKPTVTVGHGPCAICGADVLQLEPTGVDGQRPECRMSNRRRILVGAPQDTLARR
jgi:hypothetical protein